MAHDHHPSQALPSVPQPSSHSAHDASSFSNLFDGVIHSDFSPIQIARFQGQFGMSHQEALASVTAKAAQASAQMDQAVCAYSSAESPSVPKSQTSMPNSISTPGVGNPLALPHDNDASSKEREDQKDFSDHKKNLADTIAMNTPKDGYNWRKYGQKQVKSAECSRSYYRCTYSDCGAKKKVQQCHKSGFVVDVVYKGCHNHDPPRKIRCTQPRKFAAGSPVEGSDTVHPTAQKPGNSDQSIYKSEPGEALVARPELEQQKSRNSDGNTGIKLEEESGDSAEQKRRKKPQEPPLLPWRQKQRNPCSSNKIVKKDGECCDGPKPKERVKEGGLACAAPLFNNVKESKIIVHAAGDMGFSSDGYRWRKYGQKMVKGNPYPRSYYRCTSAGCPVRKRVERDTTDKTAMIVTYEGKHDHDRPVPKKGHSPPTAAYLIAAAAAMNKKQCKRTETLADERSPNRQSVDVEHYLTCQKAMELGGEKALESARTLLSIGIEIKPC